MKHDVGAAHYPKKSIFGANCNKSLPQNYMQFELQIIIFLLVSHSFQWDYSNKQIFYCPEQLNCITNQLC
jgi:hypothetical protein